jgi:signal transduction histidine kinase
LNSLKQNILPAAAITWCIAVMVDSFLNNQFGLSFIYEDWASMTPLTAILFITLFSTQFFKSPSTQEQAFFFLGMVAIIDLTLGLTFDSRVIISSKGTSLLFILISIQGYLQSHEKLQYLRIAIKFFVYCVSNGVLILYFIDPQAIYDLPWLETLSWNTAIGFLLYSSIVLSAYYHALLKKQNLPDNFSFINKKFVSFWFYASFLLPVFIIIGISLFYFFNVLEPKSGMAIALFSICLLPFPITYFIYKEMIEWSNIVYQKNKQIFHRDEDIKFHNELLREFAQITSHNLRGPAVGLENLSEIAFDEKKPDQIRQKSLDLLKEKIPTLAATINDLASFYNTIELGKVEYETCDLKKHLKKNLTSCINNSSINEKNTELVLNLNVKQVEYPCVYIDNLFYNLISNSIKYRKEEESLIIEVSSNRHRKNGVELTYRDNGIGMDLTYFKNKIFDFGTSYHNYENSRGIGLFIIKNQLSRLGDTIKVTSREGVYTEFVIKLNHHGKKELGYS